MTLYLRAAVLLMLLIPSIAGATEIYGPAAWRHLRLATQGGSVTVPADYSTVQEALDSSDISKGTGTSDHGGRVLVLQGTYNESFEIGGAAHADWQFSTGVEGVGLAGTESSGGASTCAATFLGNGVLNNTVAKVNGGNGWFLRNFCIDMDDASADPLIGIHVSPETSPNPVTKHGLIENISIHSGSSSSIGIKLGNDTSGSDTAFNDIRNVRLSDIGTGIVLSAQQTVGNTISNVECANNLATIGCISITSSGGEVELDRIYVSVNQSGQTGINIRNEAVGAITMRRLVFEWDQTTGTMINFDNTGSYGAHRATLITESRFVVQATGGAIKCIDWNRVGHLNVVSNNFESTDVARTCEVDLNNPHASLESTIFWAGNDVQWNGTQSDIVVNRTTSGGLLKVVVVEDGEIIICTGAGTGISATSAGCYAVGRNPQSANVTCAVSASYCTIWTIAGTSIAASRGVVIDATLIVDTDSTTVAPQFRVRSADTGYTGNCHWLLHESATGTTAPASLIEPIGTAPADTAGTTWFSTAPQPVQLRCTLLPDASPGDIIVEWQLETGTAPTQTVLSGSHYTLTQ